MLKNFFKNLQRTRVQETLLLATFFYIGVMLFVQYKQSYVAEKKFIVPQVEQPVERLASHVQTGIYVNNFPEFDFYQNKFIMDAVIWFRYPTGTESLDTIERFSFKNGNITYKSKPIVQLLENDVVISYHVVVEFITFLNYKYFPVSDHKLTLILENKSISPNELIFQSSNSDLKMSKNILVTSWIPAKHTVETGYIQSSLEKKESALEIGYPCVVYTVDFANHTLRNFIILYIPLFLLFLLVVSSLLAMINDISTRLGIVGAVVPILTLYSLTIQSMSPSVASMTKVDQTYLVLMFLSLIILFAQGYICLTMRNLDLFDSKEQNNIKNSMRRFNNSILGSVLFGLVVAFTYITFS